MKHGCSVITHPLLPAQLQVLSMIDGPEGSGQAGKGEARLLDALPPFGTSQKHRHGRSGLCMLPLPPCMACLTLLATGASMQQGVEEQLEGGGWAQVVQQLQDIWLRQESLASIKSLRKRPEGGSEQSPQRETLVFKGCPTHRGLGSNECCQHAAARGTWGTERHTEVAATQGQAICPLLCCLCHLRCLVLQHREALQLPILATCQLWEIHL